MPCVCVCVSEREKWNHCIGIGVRFLLNAVTSSEYVDVGQDGIILEVGECDSGQFVPCESLFFLWKLRVSFSFSTYIPSWTHLVSKDNLDFQCHIPALINYDLTF